MTIARPVALAAAGYIASTLVAFAQSNAPPAPACHSNGEYLVVSRERDGEVGTDFLVRRKPAAPGPCEYKPIAGDWKLEGSDPLYFAGLGRNYLVLTASTSSVADLVIYDIATRKKVLTRTMTEGEPVVGDDAVRFNVKIGPGNPKACRDWAKYKKDGGTGVIGAPATFDLATGKLTVGPERVCSYTE